MFIKRAQIICLMLLMFAIDSPAQTLQTIESLRLWPSPEKTRIVFDVDGDVRYKMFRLQNPPRLVVDLQGARPEVMIPEIGQDAPHIKSIRIGQQDKSDLRVVFDLHDADLLTSDFLLSPNELYGHRLVIDVRSPMLEQQEEVTPLEPVMTARSETRPLRIAIDAGHGGEDPGAIGYRGSKEKVLTLQVAKKLLAALNKDPRFNAFLVRQGDYYIKLRRRRQLAREGNADMFISIHADAFAKQSASGFSVFALSQRGATSAMASQLAKQENASDLIGGVSLSDKDEVVKKVLVDLSMTNTISESVNFGGRVLKELAKLGKLHSKRVEQAGFAVLKSTDIPSVLIEAGFITNPDEEKKLRTGDYQQKVAMAIYRAVDEYYQQTPHTSTTLVSAPVLKNAGQAYTSLVKPAQPVVHTVRRGESLSVIAARYRISVAELKRLNSLSGNTIKIGQRLKLATTQKQTAGAHKVRRGESLSSISAKYNVTIAAIKRANGLSADTVYIGQKLTIPGAGRSKPRSYRVRSGDTLSEIALRYGISLGALKRENSLRGNTILPGQQLKIP